MLMAIKWRSLLSQCDENNLLHPNQFGAVPGKNSVTPTIIEELQYKISRASKRPLVHNDYDATACYDRIVMNLASLISRSYGQHCSIVFINGNTLLQAKYVLKTCVPCIIQTWELSILSIFPANSSASTFN